MNLTVNVTGTEEVRRKPVRVPSTRRATVAPWNQISSS